MADKVKVYGKAQNRTALGIVHAYLALHPETTLEGLRAAFPGELNASYNGRFKHIFYDVKEVRYDNGARAGELLDAKQLDYNFFDEKDEIIHLADGTDIYFVQTWAKPDFDRIVEKGKEYDITVEEFEKAEGNFIRGSYRLEYINGYVPPVSPFMEMEQPREEGNLDLKDLPYPYEEEDRKAKDGKCGCCKWLMWLLIALLLLLLILMLRCCVSDSGCCDCTGTPIERATAAGDAGALKLTEQERQRAIDDSLARAEADSAALAKEQARIEAEAAMKALQTKFNNLKFATGSVAMTEDSKAVIKDVAELLSKYPDFKLNVVGHASKDGSDELNQRLSERRAEAVKKELVKMGVEGERITTEGRGSREPISETDPSLNRRTEFQVLK